jgi:methyltransferase (TIGR00027 family)
MEIGKASKTALRVGIRRAAHQVMEKPRILDDPIAVRLVGPGCARDMKRASHKVGRDFRAFMAARSRYVEDRLAEAVSHGVAQYVILGAGLDTFAYRNPFASLRVFEVDFPATQLWKCEMLGAAQIALPGSLTFVPLDFEHKALAEGLAEAGFDAGAPSFFSWLGVVPYLTLEAFRATLVVVGQLPAGQRRSAWLAALPLTDCPTVSPPPESLSSSSLLPTRWKRNFVAQVSAASSRWIQTSSTISTSKSVLTASSSPPSSWEDW